MNILVDPLPDAVMVGGGSVPINIDFRVGIQFELTMQDSQATAKEKLQTALSLYYPEMPQDVAGAVDGMLWFYRCGVDLEQRSGGGGGKKPKKAYCFQQDAGLVYAAFWACYGIDLTTVHLHWWEFRALFLGLSAECELKKVMGYRTADLRGMSKNQKKHYEKMRTIHALHNNRSVETTMSLEERDRQMRAYIAKRFEEAGERH